MTNFLFALIVTLVVYLTSGASVRHRSKRAETCSKRIPMAEYFEHGYDITEVDVFGCPEIGGKRAKLTVLNTCDKKVKFQFDDENKTKYDVPDAFSRASHTPSTHLTSGHTYSDMADLREEYIQATAFAQYSNAIPGLANAKFKNNQFYKEMKTIFARDSKIAMVYYYVGIYGLSLYRNRDHKSHFTPSFKSDINALPVTFNGNEKVYLDFIQKYGTHVLVQGRFGGIIYRYAEITKEDISNGTEININWNMRKDALALNDTMDIICEKQEGNRQVFKVHAKNRDYIQVMIGGYANASLYSKRTIPINALKESPALISFETLPISKLFKDEEEREANVEKAIKVYMAKAYIKSRVDAIQIYIDSGRKPREETNAILAKAKQSEEVYNLDELQKLGSEAREEAKEMKRVPISKTLFYLLSQHIAVK